MKKMKIIYIVWGIIVTIIIGLLTFLGFAYQKKLEPYKTLEHNLEEMAAKYVELEFLYPENGEEVIIEAKEMIDKGLMKPLKYGEDSCDGYVKLTYNGVYNYAAYIKCKNYETKGF